VSSSNQISVGIGHQPSVDEQGAPDATPEREQHHDPGVVARGTKANFGQTSSVGVIKHDDRTASCMLEHCLGVGPDPGSIHIGGAVGNAVLDDGWKGTAEAVMPLKLAIPAARPQLQG
jgi:hypothetical protein